MLRAGLFFYKSDDRRGYRFHGCWNKEKDSSIISARVDLQTSPVASLLDLLLHPDGQFALIGISGFLS